MKVLNSEGLKTLVKFIPKVDGATIAKDSNGTISVVVDKALSTTSGNPVQNSTITDYITHLIWTGTKAEYQAAIAAGKIAQGQVVQITDDDSTDAGWVLAKTSDIDKMF